MGPLQLPFQGEITSPGRQILQLTDTGNNQETDLIVAVVFSRTTGEGEVTLRLADAAGNAVRLRANLRDGESAKSIVVPMRYVDPPGDPANGVWIESASSSARGHVLIAAVR